MGSVFLTVLLFKRRWSYTMKQDHLIGKGESYGCQEIEQEPD